MKRSEKGVLGIILAATLMIGATAVVSANGGTLVDPGAFKSKGKIQVKENETDADPAIVIDSADLVTLANATNQLNTQFTDSLAAAVNNIGSVPKTDRVVAGEATFSDLLTAIKDSQKIPTDQTYSGTKPDSNDTETGNISAASEANLSLGTAAWVDGKLIVGTGADNNSYYTNGFNKGYADGVLDGQNKTGNISYIYHNHDTSSDCYEGKECVINYTVSTGSNKDYCSSCDGTGSFTTYTLTTTHSACGTASTSKYTGKSCTRCGKTSSGAVTSSSSATHTYNTYTCGYSNGEMIGATIEFN